MILSIALSVILGLSATVNADPPHSSILSSDVKPPKSKEFSLAMKLHRLYVPLFAESNDLEALVLRAGSPNQRKVPGTPAYINSTHSNDPNDHFLDAIIFDLTNSSYVDPPGLYGAAVQDHGDLHGASSTVFLVKDYQEFEYAVNGMAWHRMTAAPQSWYACIDFFQGVQGWVLKWGVATTDGFPPRDCIPTKVIQKFDIPGGCKSAQECNRE
ncbi:hypothetical protein VPNG_08190 [Cytospora leucostoma]|uniref:Uncharacterized protein n=1 Tax=Cytospora leucostoma TaxID=1230097 RepID=A0A423W785_9PEZI|nr:hypothetical protein VPNG_08190 [Cytospora leucostoma]